MLNMDFSQRIIIATAHEPWVASPMPGVWRKPLAREGRERGHATSIVRFDPGSRFSEHDHPGGEEILVLSGTFSDHQGDFGAGSYFRNPPGFRHAPFSDDGCTLLVKLCQFADGDGAHVVVDTTDARWQTGSGGVSELLLHCYRDESVALQRWPARTPLAEYRYDRGGEIYVIDGAFSDTDGHYPAGSWLRLPPGSVHRPSSEGETTVWIKTGHLSG